MKCWPLDLRHLQRDSDFSAGFGRNGDPAYTLTSAQTGGGNIPAVACVDVWASTPTIDETGAPTMRRCTRLGVIEREREREREEMDEPQYVVRRITPVEAERLQAFPDGYTAIIYDGRPAPDTLRYKALGNSMTCTVMRWLAERILEADKNGD